MLTPAVAQVIDLAAARNGIPPELLRAVAWVESGGSFKTDLVSNKGAQGLMQLMPKTAEALGVVDPFDVVQNVDGAARYLASMIKKFPTWEEVIAAYNAGPGFVSRNAPVTWNAGIKQYVRNVISHWMPGAIPKFDAGTESLEDRAWVDTSRAKKSSAGWAIALIVVAGAGVAWAISKK